MVKMTAYAPNLQNLNSLNWDPDFGCIHRRLRPDCAPAPIGNLPGSALDLAWMCLHIQSTPFNSTLSSYPDWYQS